MSTMHTIAKKLGIGQGKKRKLSKEETAFNKTVPASSGPNPGAFTGTFAETKESKDFKKAQKALDEAGAHAHDSMEGSDRTKALKLLAVAQTHFDKAFKTHQKKAR
jgi:hypothetical protein